MGTSTGAGTRRTVAEGAEDLEGTEVTDGDTLGKLNPPITGPAARTLALEMMARYPTEEENPQTLPAVEEANKESSSQRHRPVELLTDAKQNSESGATETGTWKHIWILESRTGTDTPKGENSRKNNTAEST